METIIQENEKTGKLTIKLKMNEYEIEEYLLQVGKIPKKLIKEVIVEIKEWLNILKLGLDVQHVNV